MIWCINNICYLLTESRYVRSSSKLDWQSANDIKPFWGIWGDIHVYACSSVLAYVTEYFEKSLKNNHLIMKYIKLLTHGPVHVPWYKQH